MYVPRSCRCRAPIVRRRSRGRPTRPVTSPPGRRPESVVDRDQIASSPRSPVRMRITSSTVRDEDLAVADAAGARGVHDRLDRPLDHVVLADHLDLHLGQEVHDVFGAAIELGVALLAAEPLGLDHGDALQPDLVQRFLHLVQLERLDDRFDLFHARSRPARRASSRRARRLRARCSGVPAAYGCSKRLHAVPAGFAACDAACLNTRQHDLIRASCAICLIARQTLSAADCCPFIPTARRRTSPR